MAQSERKHTMFSPEAMAQDARMDDLFLEADRAAERYADTVEIGVDDLGYYFVPEHDTFYPISDEAW